MSNTKELPPLDPKDHFDDVWSTYPMPVDCTCGCGLYVHPTVRNPKAIHISDCYYATESVP